MFRKKSKFVKFETKDSQADEIKSKGTSRLHDNEESNYVIMMYEPFINW